MREFDGINVHFQEHGGSPLIKKFHMFNSGLVPLSRYQENEEALQRIQPESIRIDLFMGDRRQEFGDLIDGTADHPVFHFEKLDWLSAFLIERNIQPYWCWCYVPIPLQTKGGTFKDGPTDFEKMGEFLGKLSAHYREIGMPLIWQEIFNEADCFDNLYTGTFEDYLKMYEYGAPAIKRGDEATAVGGPAEAFQESYETVEKNLKSFMQLVEEKQLPLDFFSFHSYGYEQKEHIKRTLQIQELLENRPGFQNVELHMNEWNVLPPPWEYGSTNLTNQKIIPFLLTGMLELLDIHDLTMVHWAQLLNSGVDELSLVSLEKNYYPAFYVFEIYNRMPISRCPVYSGGKRIDKANDNEICGISAMASSDKKRCAAVFWNNGEQTEKKNFFCEGLSGEWLDIYVCDTAFYEQAKREKEMPLQLYRKIAVVDGTASFTVALEPYEMLYIENNNSNDKEKARRSTFIWGKRYHVFETRKGNDSYALFEARNHTFYFGTGKCWRKKLICGCWMLNEQKIVSFFIRSNQLEMALSRMSIIFMNQKKGVEIRYSGEQMKSQKTFVINGPLLIVIVLHDIDKEVWVEVELSDMEKEE